MIVRPQPGPQEAFLSSSADIVLYGGAAGGGKSFGLLMEPLRHIIDNPRFYAVFFRRTTVQIRNPGGLWDESFSMYAQIPGSKPVENTLEWSFKKGGMAKFAHLEHDKSVLGWQGSQIPLICFDELTHFTAKQFWYMLSRNRSLCGVRPYIRATTNPDPDSWVAELIEWWIDQKTGFAIPERSGVIRWFIRLNDTMIWADSPAEINKLHPNIPPKSFTFINAKLSDNQALMAADPGYEANLMAMPAVERGRLLDGNWKIRPSAGLYFQRDWIKLISADDIPARTLWFRGWDLAATAKTQLNDPDWTCGTKIGRTPDDYYVIGDHTFMQDTPGKVRSHVLRTAKNDSKATTISIPKDPAQAGKAQVEDYTRLLKSYTVRFSPESGDKITRFGPFSSQAEQGRVLVVKNAAWNERWLANLEAFPEARHDDDVDSTSRAYEIAARKGLNIVRRMGAY